MQNEVYMHKFTTKILFFFLCTFILKVQAVTELVQENEVIIISDLDKEALNLFNNNDFKNALKKFDELASKSPNDLKILMAKAKCHFKMEEYQKASKIYELIYSIDNNQIYALEGWGNCALLQKNYDIAIIKYNETLKIKNSKSNLYYKIALAYFCKNDYLKSAEFSKKSILLKSINGDEVTYPLILTYLCYAQSNNDEKLKDLKNYIENFTFKNSWEKNLIYFILDKIPKTTLLSFVETRQHEIEAHTFIGYKLINSSNEFKGVEHLECANRIKGYISYEGILANALVDQY